MIFERIESDDDCWEESPLGGVIGCGAGMGVGVGLGNGGVGVGPDCG